MTALFIVQPDFLLSHVGVRRVILYYLTALRREGHQVEFAAPKKGQLYCLHHEESPGEKNAVFWTDREARPQDYSTVVITNPWLCADGLPEIRNCIGIVYDMVPNLIAMGCLKFSNTGAVYRFAHAHDVGYRYYLRNARRICCISESTQQDFIDLYGPLPAGVEIATHIPFDVTTPSVPQVAGKRVLLVNVLDARKNLSGIADVLERVQPATPLQLDIVGQARSEKRLIDEFFARLTKAGIKYKLHENISNEALRTLYRNGSVLLFPSLYEGLGLPVLEAQQEGLPCITTNISSLPEINLNPSLCFAPNDIVGMAQAMTEIVTQRSDVLKGEALRSALVKRLAQQSLVSDLVTPDPILIPTSIGNSLENREPAAEPATPAKSTPQIRPVVAWDGSFLDNGSLSGVNRAITKAIEQRDQVALTRVGNEPSSAAKPGERRIQPSSRGLNSKTTLEAGITVRHQWPPNWNRPAKGALVVIQPWEYGKLPADWVRHAAGVDEFWAYTQYVRQVYISSGVEPARVKVVPLGIDPSVFRPDVSPRELKTTKRFKFLFVGGTIHRKGPDVLLSAYLKTFTAADDVCLVIKDFGGNSVYAGQTLETQIKAAQANKNSPEILYLNEELPGDALPGLYAACDAFVHPYRGEGFGLPILEAMACGLPVIVTAGGSADDFATDDFAFRISASKQSIGKNISGMELAGEGWLLEPNVTELGERMKWVATHRDEARELGLRASEHARSHWTWDRAASIAEGYLHAIAVRQSTRTSNSKPAAARKPAVLCVPSVAQVGAATKAQDLFRRKSPRAAWESACEAIRVRPYHPEAFLLLAEIARWVGDAASARTCAQHALALAPAFKPAKKFLKGNFQGATKPDWLVLPEQIAQRAKKIRPTLSVCLIVKNEERFLRQCLNSVKDFATQIVVVDTGSTDQTVAIAREFGAEIHEFKWCDDFSAARNAALEHVTGDWVLSFDADEELPVENRAAFGKLLESESVISWRLPLFDIGRENEGCNFVPRLFRNAPGLYFIGRVHEQIFHSIETRRVEWGLENKIGDAALRHHGYTKELIKERGKVERNLRLLERAVGELPDDPLLQMNYGLELCRSERVAEGIRQYEKAFRTMSALPPASVTPETREALLTQFCTYLRVAKRPTELLPVLTSPLARQAELTASQHFLLGLAHMESEQFAPAAEQMRLCLSKRNQRNYTPINADILTSIPQHSIALCLWQAKDTDGADAAFQATIAEAPNAPKVQVDYAKFLHENGKTVEALQLLNQFASAHPTATEIWIAGGQIALSEPSLLEVAVDWTAVAVGHHPRDHAILMQRGEALLLSGKTGEALPVWSGLAIGENVRAIAARVLCETALGIHPDSVSFSIVRETGREFVRWYWRLVDFGAEPTVLQLHTAVESLDAILPDAAQLVHSVIAKLATSESV